MRQYIDGFVFPIPRDRLTEYQQMACSVAEIWQEHGAIQYCEFAGDDMNLAGTRTFIDAIDSTEDEIVVFGWVAFESREARDLANERVAADPRMPELVNSSNTGFDASRMAYGGFRSLINIAS